MSCLRINLLDWLRENLRSKLLCSCELAFSRKIILWMFWVKSIIVTVTRHFDLVVLNSKINTESTTTRKKEAKVKRMIDETMILELQK